MNTLKVYKKSVIRQAKLADDYREWIEPNNTFAFDAVQYSLLSI